MELDRSFCVIFPLVFMSLLFSASSTSFISDAALGAHAFTGRTLLQARKGCAVNFEFLNYTMMTSKCKGPHYPAESCCSAFKDFACPYVDTINDLSNDCASTMFSYINLYGRYPPGLFSSECREGKLGLECPSEPPSSSINASHARSLSPSLLLLLLFSLPLVLLSLL